MRQVNVEEGAYISPKLSPKVKMVGRTLMMGLDNMSGWTFSKEMKRHIC